MTKNEDVSWIPRPKHPRVSLKGFSTAELVAELTRRDGVETHGISGMYGVKIVHEIECIEPIRVDGPAIIIVVVD